MDGYSSVMKAMDLEFFGGGRHKIQPGAFLGQASALMLDVRSAEEVATLSFGLSYHLPVLHIPINEIPDRWSEIPKDKLVGVFCSSGTRSAMVYLYLQAHGLEQVRIIEGAYAEMADELKPGKLLKHLTTARRDA
ncbi:rhodanese-like domain-containing protein [Oligosphaera ethanolica]|uniref:Rhodanese-related sulfurtransferase n=1 Tax=Oligosphaera ethanolica TaxID=760260 RepID=A0AAE4AP35_9BACT|nr:rhodanese-like domain-containing protein [Oligosphaera ethanolica]MDQ0290306.1 rhodanese-related sulfurtransferase [Oligosphaera ethanolica]